MPSNNKPQMNPPWLEVWDQRGIEFTNLSSDHFTDNHLKPGFNVGIFSKIPVTGILDQPNYCTA
jgi:hypothetical protein